MKNHHIVDLTFWSAVRHGFRYRWVYLPIILGVLCLTILVSCSTGYSVEILIKTQQNKLIAIDYIEKRLDVLHYRKRAVTDEFRVFIAPTTSNGEFYTASILLVDMSDSIPVRFSVVGNCFSKEGVTLYNELLEQLSTQFNKENLTIVTPKICNW